jgi:predicted TIM-barrel fold metal-dependent hydrolase
LPVAAEPIRVIDTDTHVIEPVDLWTSRLPTKWHDIGPRVAYDEGFGEDRWIVGDTWLSPGGYYAMAGWPEPVPAHPSHLDEADPGGHDPAARLQRMDEYGIHAALLYPNIIAFNGGAFMELEPSLSLACVRAYNDFQTQFSEADPTRLVPLTVLPFWDLDATIAEVRRCAAMGHRGVTFAGKVDRAGLPHFTSDHWDPLYQVVRTSISR